MTRCRADQRYTSSLLLYVSGNTLTQSIMKRYHYLYKMITCQTRPADVRLSIRVAATKQHMSTFFFSHHPPPVSPSAPLLMTTTGCNGPNDNIINMLFYQLEHRPTAIKSHVSPTGRTSQVQETSQSARPRTEQIGRAHV